MDTKRTHSRDTDWLPWGMNPTTLKLSALFTALALAAGVAMAQTAAPVAAASPAKKELVAKLLKLQQPGIEAMARNLAEQPAAQLLNQAGLAMQTRVAPEKRPSVSSATSSPSPAPTRAAVTASISRMPGPPRGPS